MSLSVFSLAFARCKVNGRICVGDAVTAARTSTGCDGLPTYSGEGTKLDAEKLRTRDFLSQLTPFHDIDGDILAAFPAVAAADAGVR
jgi:hypothetical protein